MPIGLIALALGGFGIGLTEFVIMGLLPEIAADFQVSEATAGWLISGYALAVVAGALLLTAAVTRFERKPVLAVLLVLFIAGNLISAIAPGYGMMMVGRIIAALAHGAFFGIGAVVAADMVAPTKKAGAIAIMFTGLTAANVLGVPFGTMLGQAAGWRSTFWVITIIGVVALAGILALVPKTGHGDTAPGTLRSELGAFRSGQVWLSILVTILGYGGMFGAFTYIAFTLTEVSGFAASTVPWLLIIFGVGLFIGNTLGGKAADRNVDRTLMVVLAVLVVVLVGFALTAGNQVLTVASIVLMGGFGFATVPGLQMRVMKYASSAPTLASGANIGAFNVGNALGAWLGGVTITAGLGYTSPIWAGAAITLLGLGVMIVAAAGAKRTAAQQGPTGAPIAAEPVTVLSWAVLSSHPQENRMTSPSLTTSVPAVVLNNGVRMPQLGFGVFQVSDDDTTAAVGHALATGYRSIDTAAIYGNEAGTGRAIAASGINRGELFVTSKLWVADLGYDATLAAFDASLDKLGLDYLDLYLIHWPAPATDNYLDSWRALEQLLADGKVRAIGVSNFLPEHLQMIIDLGGTVPAVNQVELHPALQQRDIAAFNTAHGIATEAWSPLAQGAVLADPAVAAIADRHGVSPAQAILRWHLQQGRLIIPKSVTPQRIRENLDVFGFELTANELSVIDGLERDGRTGPHPAEFNG